MVAPTSRGIAAAEPLPAGERRPVAAGATEAGQTDAPDGTPPSTMEWFRMFMGSSVGAASVTEGGGEEATDGGQVDVAGARGPRLASEVEQEALHVLGRDRSRRSADVGEKAAGAIRESVDGIGAEPRSSMWTFIRSMDFRESLDSDMADLLGFGESQRVA